MRSFDARAWDAFCRGVVAPAARKTDREMAVDPAIWAGIREHGFLSIFEAPSDVDVYRAMQSLAEACASAFWQATISAALCGKMIQVFASEACRRRWVPDLLSGEILGCFAATERGSGSDPGNYRSSVRRQGERWRLDGEKHLISNAPFARVAAVLCREFDSEGSELGLALAVVDLEKPGISRARYGTLGMRGMGWGALVFDGVAIEDGDVVRTTMPEILTVVEWGQIIQAVCGIGLGRAALRDAEAFVSGRVSFGRPLGDNAVVRSKLDSARADIEAGAALARDALQLKLRGAESGERTKIAKIFCSEAGTRACEVAMRVAGGWGYSTELELERYFRDAHGNIPAGLPNDRLREMLIEARLAKLG